MSGVLYLVATPIGSKKDLSPRAHEVLAEVDLIYAEDTRCARALLSSCQVPARGRLHSLHEHNEQRQVEAALSSLEQGHTIALVSDAGTPVLSDPGFPLVRAARQHGYRVLSVPGASAFTAALAASGQPPLPATLVGFLPPRSGSRRRRIAELAVPGWTLVILLSPHRLQAELEALAQGLGELRPATLLVELSKMFERAEMGTLGTLQHSEELARPRGEYVLVIGPAVQDPTQRPYDIEELAGVYAEELTTTKNKREALRRTAHRLGMPRREVYQRLFVDTPADDGQDPRV